MPVKRNKPNKSPVRTVMTILFVAVAFLRVWFGYLNSSYYTGAVNTDKSEPVKNYTANIYIIDDNKYLRIEQKDVLADFAFGYATTLCSIEPKDKSAVFTEKNENYYLNTAAFEILAQIRKMSHLDLSLTHAEITYNVVDVVTSGDKVKVHLTEDNIQQFRHMDRPSESRNINHLFVLKQVDGKWLIESHEQEEDFFLLAREGWADAKGNSYAEKAANTVELIKADAEENKSELSASTGNRPENLQAADTSYNRQRAVEYASKWWNERNYTGNYLAYDDFGGNCQNFASQCLYAGGIKMDYNSRYGEWQWKFYSATLNTKRAASGRSYSWTGVDPFYTYVINNDSTGLVAQADIDLYCAEKGDVIQVGAYHRWRHSLVVTDVVCDEDGNMIDIIVASNTADRWNYPLSAYIYTYPRLIHIIGQN